MNNTVPENSDNAEAVIPQGADAGEDVCECEERTESWLAENQAALESSNSFVAKHGLPLTPIWTIARERRSQLGDTTMG